MPVDPGRLDAFFSDPNVPQTDKDAVASSLRGYTVEGGGLTGAATRAGSYAVGKGRDFLESLQRLTGLPGRPDATLGQTAQDVATVGGTAIAPIPSLVGTAFGAGARALGASQGEAEAADIAAGLGTGVVQGINAIRGVRGAVKAGFRGVESRAAAAGNALELGSQEATDLQTTARAALREPWASARERRAARYLMPFLNPRTIGETGVAIRGGPTYKELDNAYSVLRSGSPLRGAINTAMESILSPEDVAARQGAQSLFRVGIPRTGARASLYQRPLRQIVPGGMLAGRLPGMGLSLGQLGIGAAAAAPAVGRTAAAASPGIRNAFQADETPARDDYSPEAPQGGVQAPETPKQGPSPTQALKALPGPYGREIAAVAHVAQIPPEVIRMFMSQENAQADPTAWSHPEPGQAQTPAYGLMQITPGTFNTVAREASEKLGRTADMRNPLDQILAGGLLLKRYLDKTNGNLKLAGMMYFGGENPRAWGARTAQYGADIDRRWAEASKSFGAGG